MGRNRRESALVGRESGIKIKLFLEWDREIAKPWEAERGEASFEDRREEIL